MSEPLHKRPRASNGKSDHSTTEKSSKKSRWGSEAAVPSVPSVPSVSSVPSVPSGPTVYSHITPSSLQMFRLAKELENRNRQWTEEALNELLPLDGFEVVKPPEGYKPAESKLINPLYDKIQAFSLSEELAKPIEVPWAPTTGLNAFPPIKPEDLGYFGDLLKEVDFEKLNYEEQKERRVMELLLKVKNGNALIRKQALRQLTERARELGAGVIFAQILPLMMSSALEPLERHQLVKALDRVLYKLNELVRPFVHRVLVVVMPMLIEEDFYARVESREVISSLSKAAGLATMITTMRPDIEHENADIRNITARAFAVVANALGVPSLVPFLKAVVLSKKSWVARHTGVKIVQQIAILLKCSVLPHLKNLVDVIALGMTDEHNKVRTVTALALAALAESSFPYGIEAFESVLRPLLEGSRQCKGKTLVGMLKALGCLIVLMDADHASVCARSITGVLVREFESPDDDMKGIILKVVRQISTTEGITAAYIREHILLKFFRAFWDRRIAQDAKNNKQLVETTVELAKKVGGGEVIQKIVEDLKDENETYRGMVMRTIENIVNALGVADVSSKLEEKLMDSLLFAFQEQSDESTTIINGIGALVDALGIRCKGSISHICGTIQWRLNNRSPRIRMQAADLLSKVAAVMKLCGEDMLLGRMGVVLYESLGEEYPEVLGSLLAGLKAIVNVIGMSKMTPPIKDLLPRLTPILQNRHEKVQENVIDLIGRIAERAPEHVSAKEWMRICFDLLELLRAHRKGIRRATISTFGFIAQAIGPHDVLSTLLNNLKVQQRQNRVCTTVAIAIVAEACGPFTVIPALMNEYRVPETNVQNGVLKSFSFMFEYVGEMCKDYVYAVTPLLEDALIDRDIIHRQTACAAVKHLAIGVAGLGCEDALVHLLNFVWPNVFEVSPHVINSVMDALDGLRVGLGAGRMFSYVVQGLFHPARKVREVYWRVYNLLYLGNQDALVMSFPGLPSDGRNCYRATELELFL